MNHRRGSFVFRRFSSATFMGSALAALCVASWSGPAVAAWPVNGTALCTEPADQDIPAAVADGAGGAIIAWADLRAGNWDVYAQHVTADGSIAPGWPANGLAICTAPGDQGSGGLVITTDGAGGAIIAWTDSRGGGADIYAQRVTGSGTIPATWPANGVALSTAASRPTIVSDGAGGAIVAYERPGVDIYAQRVSAAGVPLWAADGVALATGPGNQYYPHITADGSGGAIVVWEDNATGLRVYVGRVNPIGGVPWGTGGVAIANVASFQQRAVIASDGSGGAIVAWTDERNPTADVYGQRVSASGILQWGAGGTPICDAAGNQDDAVIAPDGTGGAVVAWIDDRPVVEFDIYAQRVTPAGSRLWAPDGLPVCTAVGSQVTPVVCPDGRGGAIVAWTDPRNAGNHDIYAQHLSARGLEVLPQNGVAICTAAPFYRWDPKIISDGATGAIVTWWDFRNGTDYNIYAQRLFGFGAPTLEPGFPVALASGVISPPAICELDGTAGAEIVFGDAAGNIQAYNHDATVVPGWPRNVGAIPTDSPVAVGDLDGDGQNEVMCGNTSGQVYGFRADGTALPGWPVNLGTGANTYCSIGDITGASHRQVVACSGNKVFVLLPSGATAPGFPVTTNTPLLAPAAIGDVGHDGDKEIVILQQGGILDVLRGNGTVQAFRGFVVEGKTFSNAPTLADLNLDGDLEIVAPTDQGDVYVMNPDGTDFPGGWPYHDPSGAPISSVALAQIRGVSEPELIFAVDNFTSTPMVHAFFQNKVELSGYPKATGFGWHLLGMPIVDVTANSSLSVTDDSPDVIIGSRDELGYAWTNFGVDVPGWPAGLSARCEVSPASGDVDADGRVEVVFATVSPAELIMFDLGGSIYRDRNNPTWWWPMYAYNPQRQGCLNCGDDVGFLGVPTDRITVGRIQFGPPYPNPCFGFVTFRFTLPEPSSVRLTVFDLLGREVRDIVKADLSAGRYEYTWDGKCSGGTRAGAGLYYVRLEARGAVGAQHVTRKLALLR